MDHLQSPRTLLLAATLAACGGKGDADGEAARPAAVDDDFPRDTLVIGTPADAENLLAVVTQTAADMQIVTNINIGMVTGDFDCKMAFQPALATSWSWSDDGTVLSMELRDDITWQDGVRVTAQDVAFTYDLVADPVVASPRMAFVDRMKPDGRPKVIDDTHIEWHFVEAYDHNSQVAHTSMPLAPKHVLEKVDRATLRGSDFNSDPVVNGPWKLAKWERAQRIVLEPNENWTGPDTYRPKLKRVIFRVLPEYATRLVELERGDIDLMQNIQVADADRLAVEHPEIRLQRRGWRSMDYVAWNPLDAADYKARLEATPPGEKPDLSKVRPHAVFADRGVRRALAKAVDVDKLIGDLLTSKVTGEAYGRRATSTVTPALCAVHNDDIQPLPFDPAAARAELAGMGWKDTNGDGVIDKGGVEMRFTLVTNSGNPRRADAGVIIQSQLKDIGVAMAIESVEPNAFFERLRKKDYEAALTGWSAALFVDPSEVWQSGSEHEFNFVSYENPKVDVLIERGLSTPVPEEAAPIWKEMQAEIYADQPYLFLYWMDEIVGIDRRFEDTTIDVLSAYRDMHEWWVPADKVKYQR